MLKLPELEVYKVAMELGDRIWEIVDRWPYFAKDTLGKQFVNAADSVGLNIAEGYGRFFYKENRNFNYYSRGSAFECASCLAKAYNRGLINAEEKKQLQLLFERYFKLVNGYIKSIGKINTNSQVGESEMIYEIKRNFEDLLTNDLMTDDLMTSDPLTND